MTNVLCFAAGPANRMRRAATTCMIPAMTHPAPSSPTPHAFYTERIAHFDVEAIVAFPTDGMAQPQKELNPFHQMCEQLRTMPKATIAKVAGRVGGGGSELVASCDMRYGALGLATVNQMEVTWRKKRASLSKGPWSSR